MSDEHRAGGGADDSANGRVDGHERAHPDPADLALAALPAEPPDPAVTTHLTGCARCREHVDALVRTVALAQDGSADVDAGPVPERVWAAIAAELGAELTSATDGSPPSPTGNSVRPLPGSDPTAATAPRPLTFRSPGRRWRAAAAALVALVVGVGVGIGIDRATGRDSGSAAPAATVVAQLAPVGAAEPGGHGTLTAVEHDGVRTMVVHLTGVTDPAGADFLEAWLMNPATREIVALGALTMEGNGYDGSFTVPANLPMTQLPIVDISAERYDGDPGHSGVSLLRGAIT